MLNLYREKEIPGSGWFSWGTPPNIYERNSEHDTNFFRKFKKEQRPTQFSQASMTCILKQERHSKITDQLKGI